ncbi:MAG: glycosyltransferase, partial [Actinobacteria bacterium]|nr:glycosyltransferase [Actinomycetota bacterium]
SGWVLADTAVLQRDKRQAHNRRAWQRELILNDTRNAVPKGEYEKQIHELRSALATVEGSRSWRASRKIARIGKALLGRAQALRQHLPSPIVNAMIRRRHLRHVQANMQHLVDPAFLGKAPSEVVTWITPEHLPALPTAGFDLLPLAPEQLQEVRNWISAGPYDTDELLIHRTDNHDDELGRLLAALRLRLKLAKIPATAHPAKGNAVLFDARSLQTAAFGARGIGRFARSALAGLRETLGDEKVVLLVDRGLEKLPVELAGDCEQLTRVNEANVNRFSVLVQPSPMTATAEPLVALLHSSAHKIAIVFDFIPMHYPTVYLKYAAERAEYAASLDALRCYDEFLCIYATVAWPKDLAIETKVRAGSPTGPIVVMTGDEQRKNTYGALAAVGAATAGGDTTREVIVIGMAGHETRVHHWGIHAAIRPAEMVTAGRLSEAEMLQTLRDASVVVVASFDEGLSLPVIEAVGAGAHVVASDIPAHRELIGGGVYLADPKDVKAFTKAIRRHRGNRRSFARQQAKLMQHQHAELEQTLLASTLKHLGKMNVAAPVAPGYLQGPDFSAATSIELAKLCNLTIYSTADADINDSFNNDAGKIKNGPLTDIFEKGSDHDVFVTLLGNSHFHVPMLEVMKTVDSVALLHDTRMVELYLALRGAGGVEQLMLRGQGAAHLNPPLDEQINDMRLLQNAGMWEIANRARMVISHSPSAAPVIAQQTGVTPKLLLFANYRFPSTPEITEAMRAEARRRLQFSEAIDGKPVVHIASFGFIDVRTKMVDVIIESAAWLTQWGHRVSLHFVGSASAEATAELEKRAREAGIAEFEVTGFIADDKFRDYVMAVDIGLQLRISPLLGVSGPLSDMAAYGTVAMASSGLAIDVDTPAFIDRLPDEMSPLMVAEALEYRLANPIDPVVKEQQRLEYLDRKSPKRYAEALLALLQESR